ncbi:hypothetical protein OWM07_04785 [Deferribacter thermophilus]|uniref:hypothetical protein n=1 Tax=Deferribacter thermophilus TaxID=53573 RepID=UPI003C24D3DB
MNFTQIEEKYLTFLKLFDGLDIESGVGLTVCDVSFNDFISAKYLVDKKDFKRIYVINKDNTLSYKNTIPVRYEVNLAYTLAKVKVDYLTSFCGTFHFQPMYDVIYAVNMSLNVGGKFLFVVYPQVYGKNGKNVLEVLSSGSEIPVYEKLKRWFISLKNGLSNIFINIKEEELIQDVSVDEIINFFSSRNFKPYLFKDNSELNKFFKLIDRIDNEFYFVWKIISGMKI